MKVGKIGNSELISTVNNRLVLQAVRVTQPTFRAAVARMTGLKPATITMIVNGMIDEGILCETAGPQAPSARYGRPPLMLEVNADYRRVLAIDLEPDRIRVALTDLLANIITYREKKVDRFSKPAEICKEIIRLADDVMTKVDRKTLEGIGVSLPGLVDCEAGVLISSTNMPQWKDVPIAQHLSDRLKSPVRVERSIRLAALYEKWSNPQLEGKTVLVVSVRTGIGMCMMHEGEVYRGNLGFDGEIGHTVIDLKGPQCECGSRGCLEAFIGAPAIKAAVQADMDAGKCPKVKARVDAGDPLEPELIYHLAADGDAYCVAVVRRIGHYLGIALSNMINLLAPHEIVVGGSIDIAGELVLDALRAEVARAALPRTRAGVVIRLATQQERLPLLGAAVLVAQNHFALPQLKHRQLVHLASIDESEEAGQEIASSSSR